MASPLTSLRLLACLKEGGGVRMIYKRPLFWPLGNGHPLPPCSSTNHSFFLEDLLHPFPFTHLISTHPSKLKALSFCQPTSTKALTTLGWCISLSLHWAVSCSLRAETICPTSVCLAHPTVLSKCLDQWAQCCTMHRRKEMQWVHRCHHWRRTQQKQKPAENIRKQIKTGIRLPTNV